jgi:hypothetical protein
MPTHRTASNLPKRWPPRSMILGMVPLALPMKADNRRNSLKLRLGRDFGTAGHRSSRIQSRAALAISC